jgi:hypothetical protein
LTSERANVDLYWLPLGAGGRFVRLNGRVFEAIVARLEKRPTRDLYHSALVVSLPEGAFVIEQAPVRDEHGAARGVVAEGPVGSRGARRLRIFRYETRRWRDGVIPDVAEAVDSPQRLTDDPAVARRLLELVTAAPAPVWGRDELHAGEMWNSNSLVAWLVERSGLDADDVRMPAGGRAPGWRAGIVVARRAGASASLALGLEQALVEGVADELRAGRDPELLHDVRAVGLGRTDGDVEPAGDLLVRVPEREQA